VRTSSSMYFKLSMYDMVTGYAVKRLSRIAGLSESHAEPISLLRYLPGQEYKPHYDYFAESGNRPELVEDRGGQRAVTVFAYLNDVGAGGETDFPLLEVRVPAKQGKAVKFFNCLKDGTPNKKTLHAGMPVVKGEKWLATLWFREQPFIWGDKD
ncbi:MAG TPA: 2OG-Fe(II) oxygenase, partial [Gammaproteobacteria bacterium]|nr:2OG-Fe(II) oxygenase [Gammaproteobacteria bacterium]